MICIKCSRLIAAVFVFFAIGFAAHPANSQTDGESLFKQVMEAQVSRDTFNDEDKDYGATPPDGIYTGKVTNPTPTTIPGAKLINTGQLLRLMQTDPELAVIDVGAGPRDVESVPYATLLRYAGSYNKKHGHLHHMEMRMRQIMWARPNRNVVFLSNEYKGKPYAWFSYNAAIRAVELGYKNIYWYRGGREAWIAAKLPTLSLATPDKR